MKIKVKNLRVIIKEAISKQPTFEVVICYDKDEFSDMMGGGTYYEDMGWPDENVDPNCSFDEFNTAEEALNYANHQLKTIVAKSNANWSNSTPQYRALVYHVTPRGKRTLVKEIREHEIEID